MAVGSRTVSGVGMGRMSRKGVSGIHGHWAWAAVEEVSLIMRGWVWMSICWLCSWSATKSGGSTDIFTSYRSADRLRRISLSGSGLFLSHGVRHLAGRPLTAFPAPDQRHNAILAQSSSRVPFQTLRRYTSVICFQKSASWSLRSVSLVRLHQVPSACDHHRSSPGGCPET
jgi:hypothetical protein